MSSSSSGSLRRQFGCWSVVPGRLACSLTPERILELQHHHARGRLGHVGVHRGGESGAAGRAARAAGARARAAGARGRRRVRRPAPRGPTRPGTGPVARATRGRSPSHQPASVGRSCVLTATRASRGNCSGGLNSPAPSRSNQSRRYDSTSAARERGAHLVGHGAEVLADHQAAVAVALEREDGRAALRAGSARRRRCRRTRRAEPRKARQSHHVVDAQRAGVRHVARSAAMYERVAPSRAGARAAAAAGPSPVPCRLKSSGGAPTLAPRA